MFIIHYFYVFETSFKFPAIVLQVLISETGVMTVMQ